jgi:hypothetical protein
MMTRVLIWERRTDLLLLHVISTPTFPVHSIPAPAFALFAFALPAFALFAFTASSPSPHKMIAQDILFINRFLSFFDKSLGEQLSAALASGCQAVGLHTAFDAILSV